MRDFYTNPKIAQYNAINKGNLGHAPDEDNTKLQKVKSIDDLPIHVDSIKKEITKLQEYQDRFGYTLDIPNSGYKNFENWVSETHNPTPPYIPREYSSFNNPNSNPQEGLVLSLAVLGLYLLGRIGRKKGEY